MQPKTFREYLKRTGIPARCIAKFVDVENATVYNWVAGRTRPRSSQMLRMAELFDVSPEFIRKLFREE